MTAYMFYSGCICRYFLTSDGVSSLFTIQLTPSDSKKGSAMLDEETGVSAIGVCAWL